MNWQQIISLIIVAASAFLLVRSFVRKWNRSAFSFCEDECGCSASDLVSRIPADQLKVLRQQQKHRAQPGNAKG